MQNIIVAVIILLAAFFTGRTFLRGFTGRGSCGCGCSGCGLSDACGGREGPDAGTAPDDGACGPLRASPEKPVRPGADDTT